MCTCDTGPDGRRTRKREEDEARARAKETRKRKRVEKGSLAEERDEVVQWVAQHVEPSESRFFHLADALSAFNRVAVAKLGKKKFNERLQRAVPGWHAQKTVKGIKRKSLYWGQTLV